MNDEQIIDAKPADIAVYQEPKTQTARAEFRNEFDVQELLATAGKLVTDKKQREVLFAQVNPDEVEIRPDGIIYVPWERYATRLRQAFGTQWAHIPQGMPKWRQNDNLIIWGHWLVVDGHLMSFAIGQQEYKPSNARMTWTDACEGAASNALMRNCKHMGMNLELWNPPFVRDWIARYAEQYDDPQTHKRLWRKRETPLPGKAEATAWKGRRDLIEKVRAEIPYYHGEPHILNAIVMLEKQGKISLQSSDDEVYTALNAHAHTEADKEQR